jgi:hypothetical protein
MKRNTTIFASSLVLSISLVASSAMISNAVSTQTIKAWAVKKTGDLRIITGSAKCKKTERLVTWGTKGTAGAKGSTGATGATGAAGAAAIPTVTEVNNYSQGWVSIFVANGGWNTVSLVQSPQLTPGDYLVFTNVNMYPNGEQAFCSVTTTPEMVGTAGSTHHTVNIPTGLGSQNLSFSTHLYVEAGDLIHLRCAGNTGAEASDASMTIVPVN